jgi:hypothetical protein
MTPTSLAEQTRKNVLSGAAITPKTIRAILARIISITGG